MNKQNLLDLGKRIETIIHCNDNEMLTKVVEILNVLKSLEIDPILIRNAKIILTVNNLRKRVSNEEVINLSKSLLISWKRAVITENKVIRNYLMNTLKESNVSVKEAKRRLKVKEEIEKIIKFGTNDENRMKSRDLLWKALMADEDIEEDILKIVRIATEIEKYVFYEFKKTDHKYKTRIRSRVSNLSDEQNSSLRLNVLNGVIKVQEIAKMSAEDMASDEMKELRQRFQNESMTANLLPEVFGTTSDLLKCPKCKQNTCSYNQVQIERADEPMTTFCLCIGCGYRWKFN